MVREPLDELKSAIGRMRRGATDDRAKPHKPVMLLAVLDLFDANLLAENEIPYNQELIERFAMLFEAVRHGDDWRQPAPPFFHLRSSDFWFHKPLPGREEAYSRLT